MQTREISVWKGLYSPVKLGGLVKFDMLMPAANVCLPSAILLNRLSSRFVAKKKLTAHHLYLSDDLYLTLSYLDDSNIDYILLLFAILANAT